MADDAPIAYRHIQCGQATMQPESDIKNGEAFCVNCGRYEPVSRFLEGNTNKDLK